jgi:hypothetical protein
VALTSQTARCQLIWLQAGQVANSITLLSGTTALAGGNHQQFGLYDTNMNRLAVTNDDTSNAWSANTAKTLSLTGAYTVTTTGSYYVVVLVDATTTPSLTGAGIPAAVAQLLTPVLLGNSTAAITSLPASIAAPSGAALNSFYGYVS